MTNHPHALSLVVADIDEPVPGVRALTLRSPDGRKLPPFVPGSHLTVGCGERNNAYSLTGDGVDPDEYHISVLKVDASRGGSRWIHESLSPGSVVTTELPRSAFPPIVRAARHLLIAGGIGITPIVSHLRAARVWQRDVQVLYVHREGAGAHTGDVLTLTDGAADIVTSAAAFCDRLRPMLADQPVGTHLYVCGPPGLIETVMNAATELGWPPSRLHCERFGADTLDPGEPFEVVLATTGGRFRVPAGTSLLEVLEREGIPVANLCRQGVCGECRVPVVSGVPLHRDLFLSDEEKRAGDALMCCVSRSDGPRLEVAL